MIHKAYKFRIYPDKKAERIIQEHFDVNCFVYNYFLKQQEDISLVLKDKFKGDDVLIKQYMRDNNLYYNNYKANAEITKLKKLFPMYSFLKNVYSSSIIYTTEDLRTSFNNMKKTGSGFPNYKNWYHVIQSYSGQFIQGMKISIEGIKTDKWCKMHIPSTPKNSLDVKICISNEEFRNKFLTNEIKIQNFTISRNAAKEYYISFCCEVEYNFPIKNINSDNKVGIDLGIKTKVTTSDIDLNILNAKIFEFPKIMDKEMEKLKKLQIELSRKTKGSNSFSAKKTQLAKLHNSIVNKRNYINHNITNSLLNSKYDVINIEKLEVKQMINKKRKNKNKKFTKNRMRSMRRNILDVSFNDIKNKLVYKSIWKGKEIKLVDPRNTSKTCNICGYIKEDMTLNDRIWTCVCGAVHERDYNAAINIKNK